MTLEEIAAALETSLLQTIDDVDPSTAGTNEGFLTVGGLVVMPLNAVSWALDRGVDREISDDLGGVLGTLCLVSKRAPVRITEMTRWQYASYLSECSAASVTSEFYQFAHDYAVIEYAELPRYMEKYMSGSALWGGYSHGFAQPPSSGWKTEIKAVADIVAPTVYHGDNFRMVAEAPGPREHFLKLYHAVELLFDYVTFRKLVHAGEDLAGFGKVMQNYQRTELEKLKLLIKEFCQNTLELSHKLGEIQPYFDRAEAMFQGHTKDGNPLQSEDRWLNFKAVLTEGVINGENAKKHKLANNPKAYEELIYNIVAYFIYRLRSSIAHSRVGEYVLTADDDEFLARFGIPLMEAVAVQMFSAAPMATLIEPVHNNAT